MFLFVFPREISQGEARCAIHSDADDLTKGEAGLTDKTDKK